MSVLSLTDKSTSIVLRIAPIALKKLKYFRDKVDVEVGGFFELELAEDGSIFHAEDNKRVIKAIAFHSVKFKSTATSIDFDDLSVGEYRDSMCFGPNNEILRNPKQVVTCWVHTHPNISPKPSGLDEEVFKKNFKDEESYEVALMYILSKNESEYCRIMGRMNSEVLTSYKTVEQEITVEQIQEEDEYPEEWKTEFDKNVEIEKFPRYGHPGGPVVRTYHGQQSYLNTKHQNSGNGRGNYSTGSYLEVGNVLQAVYLKYNVSAVSELKDHEVTKLRNSHRNTILTRKELDRIEKLFIAGEKPISVKMLNEHVAHIAGVQAAHYISYDEIPESRLKEICLHFNVRPSRVKKCFKFQSIR